MSDDVHAGLAQEEAQGIRNAQGAGSSPAASSDVAEGGKFVVRCSVCGRPLRSAESIARGMGRDCWRKSRRGG